ncbi:putative metal-binding motif-containing protein, partial [Myxococcota bacterium]|nr:putative metal-binding motif-containing protein [Myxococcota bacterium]
HWQGDPLVRRMFLGEPTTTPEPVAATLIRELWSAQSLLGQDLSAKIDALERALLEKRGRGCLDEPTEEVQPSPPEEQSTLQLHDSEPPGAYREWHRLDPRWASEVFVAPSERISSVDQGDERSEANVEAGLGSFNVHREPPAAQASIEGSDERSISTPAADEAHDAPRATDLSDPGASAAAAQDEGAEGALLSATLGDEPHEAARLLGSGDPEESTPATQDEPPAGGVGAEAVALSSDRLYELPTEEIPLGSSDWSYRPEGSPDQGLVHSLERGAEGQASEAAAAKDEVFALNVEDADKENDGKTLVEGSGGASPNGVRLNSAPTQVFPSALSSSPTLIHIPRATAAELAALPSVATSQEPTPPVDASLTASQADNQRGRSMVIAASVGLLAALLALWIIWHRSITPNHLPERSERALGASGPATVAPQALPRPQEDPPAAAGPEVGEAPPAKAPSVDCYPDQDRDGFWAKGARPERVEGNECPQYTAKQEDKNRDKFDCNDGSAQDYPGASERCDGWDNDCDGEEFLGDRDDDKNGEIDCRQEDFGKKHMKVSASPLGGPGNPNYSLEIQVGLPETAVKGATCTPYLIVENRESGKMAGTLKRGDGEWTCHVPIGDSTPLGERCFPKGKRLVPGDEEVNYTVSCCFFDKSSYGRYQSDGYKDPEKRLTCEFWSSGSKKAKY